MGRLKRDDSRSEIVTVRVHPKMRYGLELIARKAGMSLSDVALLTLGRLTETDSNKPQIKKLRGDLTPDLLEDLWHADPIERFVRLAILGNDLLTDSERKIWNRIIKDPRFWNPAYDPHAEGGELFRYLDLKELRDKWDEVS